MAETVSTHARLCTPRLFQGVGGVPAVCPLNTSRLASRELGLSLCLCSDFSVLGFPQVWNVRGPLGSPGPVQEAESFL